FSRSSDNCNNSLLDVEDSTSLLPKTIVIYKCESCQIYSHHSTKGSFWLKAPLNSILFKEFVLKRIRLYCNLLQLRLINSVSKLAYKPCNSCSSQVDETRLQSVEQLRPYAAQNTSILRSLELCVLSNPPHLFNMRKIKQIDYGIDFLVTNDAYAKFLFSFLKTQAPIKHDEIHRNTESCQSFISALVCPVCKDDLVYLPPNGPLLVCITLYNTLHFIDPLTLKRYQFKGNDYWRDPFESLKTGRELVDFIVHDVNIVLNEIPYSLVEAKVARVLDSGKYGMPMLVRTHLGNNLKPGDHALGYDLSDFVETGNCSYNIQLPSVVLIKKYCSATKLEHGVSRKKMSPEYEQFLQGIEKNREAMFNLSLNDVDGDAKNQNSEMSSENGGFAC
ncbi:60S ribosomal export protein NMD3, partial [Bienertia sinuspersici]